MPIKLMDITLYSVEELAKIFSVTPTTLRSYFRDGKLKGQKIGGKWYISERNLKKFLKINGEEGKE